MIIECLHCCATASYPKKKRDRVFALGWRRLILAGEGYWLCPRCTKKAPKP